MRRAAAGDKPAEPKQRLRVRFACPLPSRANEQHGRRRRGRQGKKGGHLGDKMSLPAEQRAATAAALGWWCEKCGAPGKPEGSLVITACRGPGRGAIARPRLPIVAGPEHPVDVLLVRYPSAPYGKLLDPGGNLATSMKTNQDAFAEQIWRWNKLQGKPDDSVSWLRWSYRQADAPRLNGTEQCEIVVAPREDCCCGRSMLPVRWERGL
jgi:hypothetical protein